MIGRNSKILITGGAGLVGSHIVDLLVKDYPGCEVVVLDNLVRGRRENLAWAQAHGDVRIVEGDIRDQKLVAETMRGVDLLFHEAAIRITQSAEDPRLALEVLVDGTFNVMEAAVKAGVKKVVAASSASVYGMAERFPTTEDHHPYNNRTLYGAAKSFNESLLRSFREMYGLDYVALRYFNIYGPRMDARGAYTEVLIRWMERIVSGQPPQILGDGQQTMDFIHVEDVVRANLLAAQSKVTDEVFNIASGTETSLNELAFTLLKVMNSELHPAPGPERKVNGVPRRLADISKAREMLGFKACVPLEDGLRCLVAWWRKLQQDTPRSPSKEPRRIPITRPFMDEKEADAARRPILSGWVTQGPEVAAFEREFAAYLGAPYACAVSSCTAALHLALQAVGVQPGTEVISVSHSFIATANSIRHCGATPVFVDIQPDTFNIDPARIADAITERTRAILCVHQMGMPCDLKALLEIARRHSLALIEDAACAVGSEILWQGRWEKIGKPHADIACFSFHPRKVISTGDGGMLTTANPQWDRLVRLLRQHGMNVSDSERHGATKVTFESYPCVGYNYRMTDIQAAVGREQLKRLPDLLKRRRELAQAYRERLTRLGGLIPPEEPAWARSNWQSYCVRLPEGRSQAEVMQALLDAGISTRRGIMCAHREPAFRAFNGSASLPASERAQDLCILLPLYPQMTTKDQDYIVEQLSQVLAIPSGIGWSASSASMG